MHTVCDSHSFIEQMQAIWQAPTAILSLLKVGQESLVLPACSSACVLICP